MAHRAERQGGGFFPSSRRAARAVLLAVSGVLAGGLAAGARAQQSMLDPKGSNAERIADLSWLLIVLGTAVFVVVMALVAVAVFRGRHADGSEREAPGGSGFVIGGTVVTVGILGIVLFATFWTLSALADIDEPDALRVHIVGHQFWWEVRYPDHDVVTANEVHIPVGQPVRLTLTSDDVIHSFWVPELAGKTDLIPGKTADLTLQADQAGEYRGQCAEFCGLQHANMALFVFADPVEDFERWLAHHAQPAAEPANEVIARGQQVFLSSACVYCHTVRGTNATGEIGPDLTHLASREYLAAGVLENNRGTLGGWIVDPQAIKPGNLMPGTDLPAEDLQALLTYLESLE